MATWASVVRKVVKSITGSAAGTSLDLFSQRQDVVIKTALRMVRRYFVNKFNEISGYMRLKKGKDGAFYLEKVREFVGWLSSIKST